MTISMPASSASEARSSLTLSAVICAYTFDRWTNIAAAVSSLQRQSSAPAEIILVIDHNDVLFATARHHFAAYPAVRVLQNTATRGLSGARNTGVAAAHGEVVAFLDDDATVAHSDWAATVVDHFADPHVQVVGGSAVPAWSTGVADWLPPEFYWVIGCSFTGQPSTVTTVRNVLGCNMAIRREVMTRIGDFDDAVGRGLGRLPMGNEETEICIRVKREIDSARVLYDPSLVVRHEVTAERTTFGYFARRCYAEGLSKARLSTLAGTDDALSSERTYATRTLPLGLLRELRRASLGRAPYPRPIAAARAGALVAGLAITVAGYLRGRIAPGRSAL